MQHSTATKVSDASRSQVTPYRHHKSTQLQKQTCAPAPCASAALASSCPSSGWSFDSAHRRVGRALSSSTPKPSCPFTPRPHASTVPVRVTASVWRQPEASRQMAWPCCCCWLGCCGCCVEDWGVGCCCCDVGCVVQVPAGFRRDGIRRSM